jgi:hypothetical protein
MTIPTIQFEGRLFGYKKTRDKEGNWVELPKIDWDKIMPEPNSGCWLWIGACNGDGYATIHCKGKTFAGHRVIFQRLIGSIPKGMQVLHKCDVPFCLNPDHLWLGSHTDNMRDKKKKDRVHRPHGELNGHCKLTKLEALEIKSAVIGCWKLSKRYGMSVSTIQNIRNGRIWRPLK